MYAVQEAIINEAIDLIEEKGTDPDSAVPWAVMRWVEGHGDYPGLQGRVTVGYGRDREMEESGHYPEMWWEKVPPVEGYRFRIFIPEEHEDKQEILRSIRLVMAQIGALPVCMDPGDHFDSYEHRGRESHHFVLPDNSPIHTTVSRLL